MFIDAIPSAGDPDRHRAAGPAPADAPPPPPSRTKSELHARHHALFPPWLLLVCSARKQSKTITRQFTGFRKIGLDDLRKAHVVRDVQQYILCRLDLDERLRRHLSRETADTLNQLHIKCNGCFLYLEKVGRKHWQLAFQLQVDYCSLP